MSQGLRNTEEVLILTCTPKDVVTVLEWRPFKSGNTLGEIITAHNLRCDGLLQEKTPKTFIDCLPEIKPALTIGTCLAEDTGELSLERFNKVKILLLDLDSGQHNQQRLEPVRKQLAMQDRIFHLVQVSRSSRSVSWGSYFGEKACLLRSDPEVFHGQSELEKFLHVFREAYENGWAGVIKNPLDAPHQEKVYNEPYIHPSRGHFLKPHSEQGKSVKRVYRDYRKALPNLLTGIRDVAMARRLPEDQVVNLGRTAAIQELLLTLIAERSRPYQGCPVSVNPIRMPLYAMPTARPLEMWELQKIPLIELQLPKPFREFSADRREALAELGFDDGVRVAVHFDRPEVWEKINRQEKVVKSDPFEAELPGWPARPGNCRAGLNEISFGLNIEESLSRDMEVQYAQVKNDAGVFAENDLS
jgi:hypothetical protein